MKSPSLVVAASVLFAASSVTAWLEDTVQGCYSDLSGYTFNNTATFQTDGLCQGVCAPAGYNAMATTKGSDCWCGAKIPSASLKVDDALCDTPCSGYGPKTCGGASYYTVYISGRVAKVETDSSTSSSTSSSGSTTPSSTKSAAPSLVTVAGETVVVTAAPGSATSSASASTSTTAAAAKSSGGPSKAGIAAGVVVGIVAIAAIAGGAFLFIRNKNRREVEEEYRRNAAVSSFIAGGGKPPNSSGGASSFNDTRLEPSVMAQRRMSDGSIADNQDYSRRILKVTNA